MTIPDFATVRVVQLRNDIHHASIASSFECAPLPQIGDEGTVVEQGTRPGFYIVESNRADGRTDWLIEFAEDELLVISTPDRTTSDA